MPSHFVAAALGHNPYRAVRQIPKQGRVLLLHVKNYCSVLRCIDVVHKAIDRRLGATNLALQQRIESPLYIARAQGTPVMKLDAAMKMKNVGERMGNFPALG